MNQQAIDWTLFHDSTGQPLEKRPDEIFPGTNAVLFNESDQVLLHKRSDNGAWGLPGGRMEIGETVEQCAVRETFEETGLHVAVKRLVGVYSDPNGYSILRYPSGYAVHYVIIVFEVMKVGGELQISEESTALDFFDVSDLPDGIAPSARIRVQDTLVARDAAFYK